VSREVRACADHGHRSGTLQDPPVQRFLSGHVFQERHSGPPSCIPHATSLAPVLDELFDDGPAPMGREAPEAIALLGAVWLLPILALLVGLPIVAVIRVIAAAFRLFLD
jgi:hypothetical protein